MSAAHNLCIGGIYYMPETDEWLYINKRYRDGTYKCHRISIESDGYSEDIEDLAYDEIKHMADLDKRYTGMYSKKYGLYAVWDGANTHTIRILQDIPEYKPILKHKRNYGQAP